MKAYMSKFLKFKIGDLSMSKSHENAAKSTAASKIRDAIVLRIDRYWFMGSTGIAKKLGIRQSSLSRFLNGKQGLEFNSVEKLFGFLGLEVYAGTTSSLIELIRKSEFEGFSVRQDIEQAIQLLNEKLDNLQDPTPEEVWNYLGDRGVRAASSEDIRFIEGWAFHYSPNCYEEDVICYDLRHWSLYAEPFAFIAKKDSPFRRMSKQSKAKLVQKLNEEAELVQKLSEETDSRYAEFY